MEDVRKHGEGEIAAHGVAVEDQEAWATSFGVEEVVEELGGLG